MRACVRLNPCPPVRFLVRALRGRRWLRQMDSRFCHSPSCGGRVWALMVLYLLVGVVLGLSGCWNMTRMSADQPVPRFWHSSRWRCHPLCGCYALCRGEHLTGSQSAIDQRRCRVILSPPFATGDARYGLFAPPSPPPLPATAGHSVRFKFHRIAHIGHSQSDTVSTAQCPPATGS